MTKIVKENIKMTENEKKLLVELICNEQTHMIVKDHTSYDTYEYKELEAKGELNSDAIYFITDMKP